MEILLDAGATAALTSVSTRVRFDHAMTFAMLSRIVNDARNDTVGKTRSVIFERQGT